MADEPVCHFWKLPPELREMVLEYAYSEEEVMKIKDRAQYKVELGNWSRGDRRPATKPTFSECPLAHVLVSKQFFDEALPAFFRRRTLKLGRDHLILRSMVIHGNAVSLETLSAVVILDAGSSPFAIEALPKLRVLKIELSDRSVMLNDKVPWLDELDDTELISSPLARPLFNLRGIQQLTVEKDLGWRGASEKALIEKNLDRLEGLVRQQVSKPWPDQRPQTHPMGIATALMMTKKSGVLERGFNAFESEAEQAAISLADSQVPSNPSKLARLFLDRPQDVCAYFNKLRTEYGKLRAENASLRMKNDQLRKMMNQHKEPPSDSNNSEDTGLATAATDFA